MVLAEYDTPSTRQGEAAEYLALHTLAERHHLPMVATGHMRMHCRERKLLSRHKI